MSERILVFGRNGQVARALGAACPEATFTSQPDCDFERPETVIAALERFKPAIVVNPSAFTEVDKAETEYDTALRINAHVPNLIAKWCRDQGASLIHFSTDYVYSGTGDSFWKETDKPGPLNKYAQSKLEGEKAIQAADCHHFILRTSWLYSLWGKNFVRTMLRLGQERETLGVINDQFGAPTYAADLARAVVSLIRHPEFRKYGGIYNIANSGITTWHGLAARIFDTLRSRGQTLKLNQLNAITTEQYPLPAERPKNSRLDTSRIAGDFGIKLRPWEQALDECLTELT